MVDIPNGTSLLRRLLDKPDASGEKRFIGIEGLRTGEDIDPFGWFSFMALGSKEDVFRPPAWAVLRIGPNEGKGGLGFSGDLNLNFNSCKIREHQIYTQRRVVAATESTCDALFPAELELGPSSEFVRT